MSKWWTKREQGRLAFFQPGTSSCESVQSRTPILLRFLVRLPSVTATGQASGGGWSRPRSQLLVRRKPEAAAVLSSKPCAVTQDPSETAIGRYSIAAPAARRHATHGQTAAVTRSVAAPAIASMPGSRTTPNGAPLLRARPFRSAPGLFRAHLLGNACQAVARGADVFASCRVGPSSAC